MTKFLLCAWAGAKSVILLTTCFMKEEGHGDTVISEGEELEGGSHLIVASSLQ